MASEMVNRLYQRAMDARAGGGPYRRAALAAQRAYNAQAFDALGKAQGEELAGTPGFLAAQSMAGPGSLARLRNRNLRAGVSRLASGLYEGAAEASRAERDFMGEILKMREKKRLEKQKGGGIGGTLKRLAGGAVGFLTGGPAGAATALVGSDLGLPGKAPAVPAGYEEALRNPPPLPGLESLRRLYP